MCEGVCSPCLSMFIMLCCCPGFFITFAHQIIIQPFFCLLLLKMNVPFFSIVLLLLGFFLVVVTLAGSIIPSKMQMTHGEEKHVSAALSTGMMENGLKLLCVCLSSPYSFLPVCGRRSRSTGKLPVYEICKAEIITSH